MTLISMRTPMRRTLKASILSLAVALGLSACSNDYTVSYVYMITQGVQGSTNHSLLNSYQVDYQSGFLYTMPDSPNDTGGRDGVALVVAPNNLFLYTVNNFDSNVVEFAIGTDGKLYPQNTYNITGSLPVAAAIDTAGKFLYVAFTYQNNQDGTQLYSPSNPGPGGITVFPINADNTLGKPVVALNGQIKTAAQGGLNDVPVGRNPVGIATSPLHVPAGTSGCAPAAPATYCTEVWLTEQDTASSANVLGFLEDPGTGALAPLPGVTVNPGNAPSTGFASGPAPSGLLADSTGTHLYVTDLTQEVVGTYAIGSNGVPALAATTPTDAGPMGMSFDLQGKYLYIAASQANAIDGYTIGTGGVPVRSTVAGAVQAGTGPTCVAITGAPSNANPTHAVYLYVSNSLSHNVTAEQLNEKDGSLDQVLGSPFEGSTLPACIATAPALPLR